MQIPKFFLGLTAAMAGVSVSPHSVAASDGDNPAALIDAFNATCRRAFPDLETIKRTALADGWIERNTRAVGGNSTFQSAVLPQVLQKGELTLFLQTPNAIGMKHGCQVATSAGFDVPVADLAAGTAHSLVLGAPELSRSRGSELAQWRLQGSMLVQATVNRRPRSASLQVRIEP